MDRGDCRNLLRGLLPERRLYHCECVADAAVALARQYGADEHKALLAGMLHDCMKNAPLEEQIAVCARAGMPLRPANLASPQVCHAFAGAAYLSLCGVTDEEVLGAVRWHTTGHAGMALLEEVVYVADLVSADRDYPDVGHVRQLAEKSLHAASRYILEYIFAKLKREGRPIEPDALAWYQELISNA
ncbi:MAG: bis(5'-nucleosyl)-tetraphosphatase (symmetrical) YqeK [Oscillospiraceae bacterium]|jgi:predicted HD superfamily hydrolase involved in NAD metabolism|nr:bis(5'-nucleosyl)-tetraphosphatase (symmetrical) YqeK [Oscillospiraceae bacterium]